MDVFPGYKSDEILYESETTLIVRCIREKDQEKVILKVLNIDYPSPDMLARFGLEYSIGSKLNIEGVVKLLAYEQFGNKPAIVMEDIGGTSLAQLLPTFQPRLPCKGFSPPCPAPHSYH